MEAIIVVVNFNRREGQWVCPHQWSNSAPAPWAAFLDKLAFVNPPLSCTNDALCLVLSVD